MSAVHSTIELPINFSPKQLRRQADRLQQDYAALEKAIDLAWESFVKKSHDLPPNLYQLRWEAFKLTEFPRTKNYDLFKSFVLMLILRKHSKYKLDDSKTYVVRMVKKAG